MGNLRHYEPVEKTVTDLELVRIECNGCGAVAEDPKAQRLLAAGCISFTLEDLKTR
jgi:hypothetical protein